MRMAPTCSLFTQLPSVAGHCTKHGVSHQQSSGVQQGPGHQPPPLPPMPLTVNSPIVKVTNSLKAYAAAPRIYLYS